MNFINVISVLTQLIQPNKGRNYAFYKSTMQLFHFIFIRSGCTKKILRQYKKYTKYE